MNCPLAGYSSKRDTAMMISLATGIADLEIDLFFPITSLLMNSAVSYRQAFPPSG
jgi:hypothetical protein